jgi:hypothetical protein
MNFVDVRPRTNKLARPTTRCILSDGKNISFDASLVIYTNKKGKVTPKRAYVALRDPGG